MTFRPYPGMTIACVLLFAILCGLGVWQLERLQWKLALIARVDGHMRAAPLPLDQVMAMAPDEAQYRRVTLQGRFDHAHENYVFTTDAQGAPVYHVLTPLKTGDGRILMVDRGEVPKDLLDPASRKAGDVSGAVRVTGVWRVPDPPGAFTPAPDHGKHIWYARDLADMARADGVALAAPVAIEVDATPNPGGWPKGGQTVVTFRNQHLSYAVTWFGLAAGLLGIWLAYHISRGRIAFK
ncbi:MAG TPA: SURF1 family protein [Rhizomicrobium sp.]|jgi:surfeit locus 1 family protein|nr:SURF1 family protein [Rhizomicrobium sp.]